MPLPGGEAAVRQPWRLAIAWLITRYGEEELLKLPLTIVRRAGERPIRQIGRLLEHRLNTPLTSSAGRLFDAVAAIIGVRDRVSYEGQAAVELEWLATEVPPDRCYPFDIGPADGQEGALAPRVVDTRPLIRAVADEAARGVAASRIARRFHSTVVEMIAAVCGHLRGETGIDVVCLTGGVFLNALLAREAVARLAVDGFRVYRHRLVPPGDGGLSLGQLAIAAACLR